METFYKIFQVQTIEKISGTGNFYENYTFRSPEELYLIPNFDTKMDAQVAIEKYGEDGVTYIIQECYRIP